MGNTEFLRVDRELTRLCREGQGRLVLCLAGLSSATPLSLARLLVWAREFQRQGGELKLAGLSPALRRLAQLEGFDIQADCQPDLATALKAFPPWPANHAAPPTCTR